MKKSDIVIIISLTLAVLAFYIGRTVFASKGAYVTIQEGNNPPVSLSLKKNDIIELSGDYGENKIVIENGTVHMEYADCPDKLCVKQGSIDKTGESIVCLPHRVAVMIVGGEKTEYDGMVR